MARLPTPIRNHTPLYLSILGVLLLLSCESRCGDTEAPRAPLRAPEEPSRVTPPPEARLKLLSKAELGHSMGTGLSWREADGKVFLAVKLGEQGSVAHIDEEGEVTLWKPGVETLGAVLALPGDRLAALDRAGFVKVRALSSKSAWTSWKVGRGPRDVVAGADRVWVLTQDPEAHLAEVVMETGAITKHKIAGDTPSAMVWDEEGKRLWFANFVSDDVTVVVPGEPLEVLPRISVAPDPYRMLLMPEAHRLVLMHANSKILSLVDTQNDFSVTQVELPWIPSEMLRVGPDKIALLSAGEGRLKVSTLDALQKGEGVEVPIGSPHMIAVSLGSRVHVVVSTGHKGAVNLWEVLEDGSLRSRGGISAGFATSRLIPVRGVPSQFWVTGPPSGRVARYEIEDPGR